MSTPRKYGAPGEYTLAELQTWLNQIEGISQSKLIQVRKNVAAKMTIGVVDLDIAKPATTVKLQMGLVPPAGADPFNGTGYVLSQATDLTVSRV